MVSLLNDEHMSILANFYNRLSLGCEVETLHFGDFTLLPKKSPHGVVANGRPLSNFSVIWKLFSMVITKALQTWLTDHDRISRTQMAMRRSTSVVHLLRILFDWIQQRWWSGLWAFLLLDDVVHAFGSVSHDTMRSSLLSAGVYPSLIDLILYAIQHVTLHMGGHQGVCLFRAMYEGGMGQGKPISALLCYLVNEVRVQLVLQSVGLTATGGPLRNLGWMDDSSWIGTSHSDIWQVASRLPMAGNLTNLFSDATKTIGFGTALRGKRVTFGRQSIHFSGMPLRIPEEGEYIRLLGRHALPHVFHRQDHRILPSSSCTCFYGHPARPLSDTHV